MRAKTWVGALVAALVTMMALANEARAQVPTTVAFSGSLSTASGPVDGAVSVTFRLFDALTNGVEVWTETHSLTADGGLVLAELGSAGTPLDAGVFDGTPLWLEVEVDSEILSPRSPIASVPYALAAAEAAYAYDAGMLGGMAPSVFQERVTGTCNPGSAIRAISADGTVVCEQDDSNPGTITGVTAGSGLTGGGTSGNVTVGIAPASIAASHLDASAVRRAELYGTETAVYAEPAGCGGGLRTTSSCTTEMCLYNGAINLFRQCNGSCGASSPVTCSGLTQLGWLIDDAMPN